MVLTIGQCVAFAHLQPFGALTPDVVIGTVKEITTTKRGMIEYFIQPENQRLIGRWRNQQHIISALEVNSTNAA